jgi:hypothetical protein
MVAMEEPISTLPGRASEGLPMADAPRWFDATPTPELPVLATSSWAMHAPSAASGAIPMHRRAHSGDRAGKGVSGRIELSIIVVVEQNR